MEKACAPSAAGRRVTVHRSGGRGHYWGAWVLWRGYVGQILMRGLVSLFLPHGQGNRFRVAWKLGTASLRHFVRRGAQEGPCANTGDAPGDGVVQVGPAAHLRTAMSWRRTLVRRLLGIEDLSPVPLAVHQSELPAQCLLQTANLLGEHSLVLVVLGSQLRAHGLECLLY